MKNLLLISLFIFLLINCTNNSRNIKVIDGGVFEDDIYIGVLIEKLIDEDPCNIIYNSVPFTGIGVEVIRGRYISDIRYEDGCANQWRYYWDNGNLKELAVGACCSEIWYEETYNEEGVLVSIFDGETSSTFYENGNVKSKDVSECMMGCPRDYYKEFYENGQIKLYKKYDGTFDENFTLSCWDMDGNKINCYSKEKNSHECNCGVLYCNGNHN